MDKSQLKSNINYQAIAGWLATGFFFNDEYFTLENKKKHTFVLPEANPDAKPVTA